MTTTRSQSQAQAQAMSTPQAVKPPTGQKALKVHHSRKAQEVHHPKEALKSPNLRNVPYPQDGYIPSPVS